MAGIDEALAHYRRGDPGQAAAVCEHLLHAAPRDIAALGLLAEIRQAVGDVEGALQCLRRLTELRPADASAWRRRAESELADNRLRDAAGSLRAALRLEPGNRRAHNNLGQALLRAGELAGAIDSFESAVRIDPDYALGFYNLGVALAAAGQGERALSILRRAQQLQPGLAAAHAAQAALHVRRCEWADALASCERALHIRPDDRALRVQRAFILLAQERAAEALAAVDSVLDGTDGTAEAHNIRGGALRRLGRRAEARAALERAVAIQRDYPDAWSNLGLVLHELGETAAAIAAYEQAVAGDADAILPRTRLLARLIPAVPASVEEEAAGRVAFADALVRFEEWLQGRTLGMADALLVAEQQFFYLSYAEQPNLRLLARYRGAAAARLAGFDGLRSTTPAPDAARLRVGFVSAHVHDHSVYNAILRGWLKGLDRDRFDRVLFSVGVHADAATQEAAGLVDRYVSGARQTADWARVIGAAGCQVLVYPELGMNSQCLALASLRLAPRQFAAWGHPETSGLPTIDGFLSADALEPADAPDHYSERLWRLPRLGVQCSPYGVVPADPGPGVMALIGAETALLCPGLPQKYRPGDDAVLVDIALRLGRCRFVFFECDVPELSARLMARISGAFSGAGLDPGAYLVLLPWQPRAAFFGLMRVAQVYLDTLGFSGFNTLMQALECGLPCVALEGRFMRGRLGSGILRTLGLDELVATSRQQYVEIAVRIAADRGYRDELRKRIAAGREALWNDRAAVDALARILDGTATDCLRP